MNDVEKLQKGLAAEKAKAMKQKAEFKKTHAEWIRVSKEYDRVEKKDSAAEDALRDTEMNIIELQDEIENLKNKKIVAAELEQVDLPPIACEMHPTYRGLNPPTGDCKDCATLYATMQALINKIVVSRQNIG
jgi:septal ring factor EnvC (AmiA/AmiB activator)